MKYCLILIVFLFSSGIILAQDVYTIKADSTKLTGCDSNELIIENHTQAIKGFLYNKGNGRTEFRKALIKINDSLYLLGNDTLRYNPYAWIQGGNRWGTTGVLGNLDSNHLDFYTAAKQRGRLTAGGNWLLGTTRDTLGSMLQVNGTSFFSDNVQIASSKTLNVGNINVVDDPNLRYISCITGQPMKYTSGKGGYILFNKSATIASDTSIIFSPTSSTNAISLKAVTAAPSSTTMTFNNLRNDGVKKAVINTSDYDASSVGGSTGIDLYMYPGKETYAGSQGNTILAYDGGIQRGRVMIGTSTVNTSTSYSLQVSGSTYVNGVVQASSGDAYDIKLFPSYVYGSTAGSMITFGSIYATLGVNKAAMGAVPANSFMMGGTGASALSTITDGSYNPVYSVTGNGLATINGGYYAVQYGNVGTAADYQAPTFSINGGRGTGTGTTGDIVISTGTTQASGTTVHAMTNRWWVKGQTGYLSNVSTPTSTVDVTGANGYSQFRMRTSYTPSATSDTNGNVGDFSWDANYLYVKTAAGWKRSALTTF